MGSEAAGLSRAAIAQRRVKRRRGRSRAKAGRVSYREARNVAAGGPHASSDGHFVGLLLLFSPPAWASWRAANPQVAAAARTPRVAAVLAAVDRMDRAILARDAKDFSAVFADDAVVNNPFNRIARKRDAERNLASGLIGYTTLERSIEYAAERGAHDVVLMGEAILTPVGKARFAGEKLRRRTTEVWTDVNGEWKLAIRQATIYRTDQPRSGDADLPLTSQSRR